MQRVLLSLLSLLLVSCQATNPAQSTYPNLAPLVQPVAQAREAQRAAAEQFQTAQEQVSQLANCHTGSLQAMYVATVAEHDAAVQAAMAMNSAIDALEQSADTLFQQWQSETAVLTDARAKAKSQARLTQTFQSYQGLIEVMRQSAAQVAPVLAALNASVESLRDNLNASAVAARNNELDALANDIGALVQQLNSSIVRSDEFIASLQQ